MSIDESRAQKALALLEFKEAEDAIAELETRRGKLVKDLHSFASMLDKMSDQIADAKFYESYGRLTPDAVYDVLCKLREAKKRLSQAAKKKSEFKI
jgi:hypothetical protein